MVIPVWFGAKLRDGLMKEAQGEDLAVPWADSSPADSSKVPMAAAWRSGLWEGSLGMTLAHVTLESSVGSKPLGT